MHNSLLAVLYSIQVFPYLYLMHCFLHLYLRSTERRWKAVKGNSTEALNIQAQWQPKPSPTNIATPGLKSQKPQKVHLFQAQPLAHAQQFCQVGGQRPFLVHKPHERSPAHIITSTPHHGLQRSSTDVSEATKYMQQRSTNEPHPYLCIHVS